MHSAVSYSHFTGVASQSRCYVGTENSIYEQALSPPFPHSPLSLTRPFVLPQYEVSCHQDIMADSKLKLTPAQIQSALKAALERFSAIFKDVSLQNTPNHWHSIDFVFSRGERTRRSASNVTVLHPTMKHMPGWTTYNEIRNTGYDSNEGSSTTQISKKRYQNTDGQILHKMAINVRFDQI